jgi:hypothetical protein
VHAVHAAGCYADCIVILIAFALKCLREPQSCLARPRLRLIKRKRRWMN